MASTGPSLHHTKNVLQVTDTRLQFRTPCAGVQRSQSTCYKQVTQEYRAGKCTVLPDDQCDNTWQSRRQVLLGATASALPVCSLIATQARSALAAPVAGDSLVLYVAPGGASIASGGSTSYPSITSALSEINSLRQDSPSTRVVVEVSAGKYQERILMNTELGNVTIRAWPQGASVEVFWQTSEPYQSVLFCEAKGVKVTGLTLRHGSKSVANNYGVYVVNESDLVMEHSDISSSTGSGVGIEGASPTFVNCRVHGCARHGVAVFGPLDPLSSPPGGGVLQKCQLVGNAGNGMLIRDGATPAVKECTIQDNKGWGVSAQFSGGVYQGNEIRGNIQGAMQAQGVFDIDLASLKRDNILMGTVELQG